MHSSYCTSLLHFAEWLNNIAHSCLQLYSATNASNQQSYRPIIHRYHLQVFHKHKYLSKLLLYYYYPHEHECPPDNKSSQVTLHYLFRHTCQASEMTTKNVFWPCTLSGSMEVHVVGTSPFENIFVGKGTCSSNWWTGTNVYLWKRIPHSLIVKRT